MGVREINYYVLNIIYKKIMENKKEYLVESNTGNCVKFKADMVKFSLLKNGEKEALFTLNNEFVAVFIDPLAVVTNFYGDGIN